ncbi:hypothetical protein DENSPDRAFT_702020 [Dentipellis sp. KUC8613]|nr:hypothetical protein DENSPDRAFT_702020 [Dentipellis sp. KUC8613]
MPRNTKNLDPNKQRSSGLPSFPPFLTSDETFRPAKCGSRDSVTFENAHFSVPQPTITAEALASTPLPAPGAFIPASLPFLPAPFTLQARSTNPGRPSTRRPVSWAAATTQDNFIHHPSEKLVAHCSHSHSPTFQHVGRSVVQRVVNLHAECLLPAVLCAPDRPSLTHNAQIKQPLAMHAAPHRAGCSGARCVGVCVPSAPRRGAVAVAGQVVLCVSAHGMVVSRRASRRGAFMRLRTHFVAVPVRGSRWESLEMRNLRVGMAVEREENAGRLVRSHDVRSSNTSRATLASMFSASPSSSTCRRPWTEARGGRERRTIRQRHNQTCLGVNFDSRRAYRTFCDSKIARAGVEERRKRSKWLGALKHVYH